MRCEACPLELVEARARARVAVMVLSEARLRQLDDDSRVALDLAWQIYVESVDAMSEHRDEAAKRGVLPDLAADDRALDEFLRSLFALPVASLNELVESVLARGQR